jgi:hypothetical protein
MKNIYNREIKQNEKLMHVGIAGKLLIKASRYTYIVYFAYYTLKYLQGVFKI